MLPHISTPSLVINANLTQKPMTCMETNHNTTQGMSGSNVMTINYQSTTNSKNVIKMTDFHAENTEESTAVPPIIFQMTSHHITLQLMVTTRLINYSPLRPVVKSTLPTITSHNGLMRPGILVIIHAEIQMLFLQLQELCLLSG